MGVERLIGLYEACGGIAGDASPDVYVVAVGDSAFRQALTIAEDLRDQSAAIKVEVNLGGGSFKSQLKRADKSGAAYAVILGEDEIASGQAGLKPLRTNDDQLEVALKDLAATMAGRLVN